MSSRPAPRPAHPLIALRIVASLLLVLAACSGFDRSLPPDLPRVAQLAREQDAQTRPLTIRRSAPTLSKVTGLIVRPTMVPQGEQALNSWMQGLIQQGVTLLLLEIGTTAGPAGRPSDGARGVYFRTEWAPVVRDVFGIVVPMAHRHRVPVFAIVSPRHFDWIEPELGWRDQSFDPAQRRLRPSPALDLFHTGYQEYLVGLLSDLAVTEVDGVLFRDAPPMGLYDGLTPQALHRFELASKISVDPVQLFTAAPRRGGGEATYQPVFWRWIGWRARERLHALERLSQAMQMKAPHVELALEVHPHAVTDPVGALALYGEDLLEAKRRFHYFLLTATRTDSRTGQTTEQPPPPEVLVQMKEMLESGERIWVSQMMPHEGPRASALNSVMDRRPDADAGVVYVDPTPIP